MQHDTITLLAKYNKAANEKMDALIKTLSGEAWEKPLGGYFPSVRSLCSHLYICDHNWLRRFRNLRDFSVLKDPSFDKAYSFTEVLFPDKAEYFVRRPELDDKLLAFAGEITDQDMEASLKYTDSGGASYSRNAGACLLHFLNHETHHRGMISLYLELLGKENDFASLNELL
jgi:uncharacterized damage-inducible protein DinB